jgi:cystathionine beta-synthase
VSHAIERMRKYKISQIPVMDMSGFVGSLDETDLFQSYVHDKNSAERPIKEIMEVPIPLCKWELQSKKFLNCSTGTMQQY